MSIGSKGLGGQDQTGLITDGATNNGITHELFNMVNYVLKFITHIFYHLS